MSRIVIKSTGIKQRNASIKQIMTFGHVDRNGCSNSATLNCKLEVRNDLSVVRVATGTSGKDQRLRALTSASTFFDTEQGSARFGGKGNECQGEFCGIIRWQLNNRKTFGMAEYCALDWGLHFNPLSLPVSETNCKLDQKTLMKNLRSFAQSNTEIDNPRTDDAFLERFLIARKNKFDECCRLYSNYFLFRQKNPDMVSRLNGQDVLIQQALRDGFPGVLENRDRLIKMMIKGLQDCFPAKFKGFHFVNQPWYIEIALTVIKPFLKDKVKERIYLHGNNLSTLHEYIPKDILPAELGGEGPPFNPLIWAEKLMSQPLE
ncbi:hypothetical protein RUM43_003648 [Polyplax serrata]|uniref:CRAL-TRIO domain-containing protein n=1 Tax=Polyplax serrata TaxID=468196 RepID=A0AAN8RXE2_POLSC